MSFYYDLQCDDGLLDYEPGMQPNMQTLLLMIRI